VVLNHFTFKTHGCIGKIPMIIRVLLSLVLLVVAPVLAAALIIALGGLANGCIVGYHLVRICKKQGSLWVLLAGIVLLLPICFAIAVAGG